MTDFNLLKLIEKHINKENTTEDISKIARDVIGMSPRDSHFDNAYSWVPNDKDYNFNRIHVELGKHQVYEEPDAFYNLDRILIWLDPDFRRAADKIKRRYNGMLSEYEMTFCHKDYLKTVRPLNNGYQWVYGFPNGYGASVIRSPYSYGGDQGKFELAVLKDGSICYDTDITQDVLGYLDESEVKQYLDEIKKLEV